MRRYFKLHRIYPQSNKLNTIYVYDGVIHELIQDNKITSYVCFVNYLDSTDLEDKEYFEESIGISKDEYVLFKGDEVFYYAAYQVCSNNVYSKILDRDHGFYYKKENVPVINSVKTWEEVNKKIGYSTTIHGGVIKHTGNKNINPNMYTTEKQALSAVAYGQLTQIIADVNGDWVADWNDNKWKYVIKRISNELMRDLCEVSYHPLAFKNEKDRDESFIKNEALWKQFFQL